MSFKFGFTVESATEAAGDVIVTVINLNAQTWNFWSFPYIEFRVNKMTG